MNDDDDNSYLWAEGADLVLTILFKAPLGMGAIIFVSGAVALLAYYFWG